jgi:hypothetical protein
LLQRKPYRPNVDPPEDVAGSHEPLDSTGRFGTFTMLYRSNKSNKAKRLLKPDRWSGV